MTVFVMVAKYHIKELWIVVKVNFSTMMHFIPAYTENLSFYGSNTDIVTVGSTTEAIMCVKISEQRGVLSNVNYTVYSKNMIFYFCFIHFVLFCPKLIMDSRFLKLDFLNLHGRKNFVFVWFGLEFSRKHTLQLQQKR